MVFSFRCVQIQSRLYGTAGQIARPQRWIGAPTQLKPPVAALGDWVLSVLLIQVLGAVAAGTLIGLAVAWFHGTARRRGWSERPGMFTSTVALTLLTLAALKLMHSDGVFAVFAAGVAFMAACGDQPIQQDVQESAKRLFSLPLFVILGIMLPWRQWLDLGWPGIAGALLIPPLRRVPVFLLLRGPVRLLRRRDDALFAGWFGPVGVSALYYALVAYRRLPGHQIVWNVATLVVFASVVLHGVTPLPFMLRYDRRRRKGD